MARQQPANVEIYDPDVYVKSVPHDAFRLLRRECPVYFQTEPKGRGYYAITKYDDIVRISKDPHTFSSARGGTNIEDYDEEDLSMIRQLMVNMDPPQHNKFRKLVSSGFTPRMTRRMESYTRAAAKQIIDNVAQKGRCDFVEDIAAQLPLAIICDLMGVPEHDRMKIFDWSNRLIGFDDPEFQTSLDDGREAAAEIWMYSNELAESRKGKEGNDLTTILINSTVDGESLTEMEFDSFILMLSVAGNETTRNLISGGLLALLEFPEQRQKLLDDMSLMPGAVEEMLRWVSPVMYFRRTVTCDTEVRGVEMHDGDKVALYYGSANRDEDVFENPETFDITRTPNDHLAFGIGQHACLGLNLARLEINIMFEELLRRLPDIRLDGDPVRLRSNFINGIKRMPVVFTPET